MKNLLILIFTFCSFFTYSQSEICGNGVNDDSDLLTDCADPDCICPEAFPCVPETEFFQLQQGTTLFSTTTGTAFSAVPGWGNQQQVKLNAMGYNIQDGFLYALRSNLNPRATSLSDIDDLFNIRLYRIGSAQFDPASPDNDWEVVGKIGYIQDLDPDNDGNYTDPNFANLLLVPNALYQTGDFDDQGHLIVAQNPGTQLHSVDLNHPYLRADDITIDYTNANSGLSPGIIGVSDIAFQPDDNAFYGMLVDANQGAGTHIRKFVIDLNTLTGTAEDIPLTSAIGCPTDFGAAYATENGDLFFYCNDNGNGQGEMHRVVPDDISPTWPSNSEFFGPTMMLNDGASCPYSNISSLPGDCCEQVLDILNNWPPPGQNSNFTSNSSANNTDALQEQIDDLKEQFKNLEDKTMNVLHQNRPNPFNERTIINYEIHDVYALNASISIFNMNGQLLETQNVPIEKNGEFVIESNAMEPGMYLYTLIVDGKEIDTKRMILLD